MIAGFLCQLSGSAKEDYGQQEQKSGKRRPAASGRKVDSKEDPVVAAEGAAKFDILDSEISLTGRSGVRRHARSELLRKGVELPEALQSQVGPVCPSESPPATPAPAAATTPAPAVAATKDAAENEPAVAAEAEAAAGEAAAGEAAAGEAAAGEAAAAEAAAAEAAAAEAAAAEAAAAEAAAAEAAAAKAVAEKAAEAAAVEAAAAEPAAAEAAAALASPCSLQHATPPPPIVPPPATAGAPSSAPPPLRMNDVPSQLDECNSLDALKLFLKQQLHMQGKPGQLPTSAPAEPNSTPGAAWGGDRRHSEQSWYEVGQAPTGGSPHEQHSLRPPPSSRKLEVGTERSMAAGGQGRPSVAKRKREGDIPVNGNVGVRTRSRCADPTAGRKLVFEPAEPDAVSEEDVKPGPSLLSSVLKEGDQQLRASLTAMRKQVTALSMDKEKLVRELRTTVALRKMDEDALNKVRTERDNAHAQVQAMKTDLAGRRRQIRALKNNFEDADRSLRAMEEKIDKKEVEIEDLIGQLAEASNENDRLHVECGQLRGQAAEAANLFNQLQCVTKKLKDTEVRKDLDSKTHAATEKSLEKTIQSLRTAKNSAATKAEKRLAAVQKKLKRVEESHEKDVSAHEKDVSDMKQEWERREQQMAATSRLEQEEYDRKLADSKAEKEVLHAKLLSVKKGRKEDNATATARMESMRAEWEATVQNMKKAHQETIISLRLEVEAKQRLQEQHELALATCKKSHQETITLLGVEVEAKQRLQQQHESALATRQRDEESRIRTMSEEHASVLMELRRCMQEERTLLLKQQELRIQELEETHSLQIEALEKQRNDKVAELDREKEAFAIEKAAIQKQNEAKVQDIFMEKLQLDQEKDKRMQELVREHEASKAEWQVTLQEALDKEEDCRLQLVTARNDIQFMGSVKRENENLLQQLRTAKKQDRNFLNTSREYEKLKEKFQLEESRCISLANEKDSLKKELEGSQASFLTAVQEKKQLEKEVALQEKLKEEKTLALEGLLTEYEDLMKRLQCPPVWSVEYATNQDQEQSCEGREFPLCVLNQMCEDDPFFPTPEEVICLSESEDDREKLQQDVMYVDLDDEHSSDSAHDDEFTDPLYAAGHDEADTETTDAPLVVAGAFPSCLVEQVKEHLQHGFETELAVGMVEHSGDSASDDEFTDPLYAAGHDGADTETTDPPLVVAGAFPSCLEEQGNEYLQHGFETALAVGMVEQTIEDLQHDAQCGSLVREDEEWKETEDSQLVVEGMLSTSGVEPMDVEPLQGDESSPLDVVLAADADSDNRMLPLCSTEPSTIIQQKGNGVPISGLKIVVYSGPENGTQVCLPPIHVTPINQALNPTPQISLVGDLDALGTTTAVVPYRPLQICIVNQDCY